jgi:hypothetical protein
VSPSRLERAIAEIDTANAADPNLVAVDGAEVPKELDHSRRMTAWVRRLDPEPNEAQLLAARAHHLRRWLVPRAAYPEGRAGYLRWRADQKRRHAEDVGQILESVGYGPDTIGRVQAIVRKEGLGRDPEVQTHEDALCLVFLETQLRDLSTDLGAEKTVAVLRKTARKMSARALEEAARLPYDDDSRRLLEAALSAG